MRHRNLGSSEIRVSEICLGSMTWGTQNNYSEAKAQIHLALEHGVNFIDTAELYPTIPTTPETQGDTERIIGRFVKEENARNRLILATKIVGRGVNYLRNGADITPKGITEALESSLRSLETDYIDLYQLHWPNRGHYHFRKNWEYNPKIFSRQETETEITQILDTLNKHMEAGKIRAIGLSNETAWGTIAFLRIAEMNGLPRVVSIQNEYSLLCRWFDLDLAEIALNENIGLLAYSPLAAGILSGKYLEGVVPPGSRASIKPGLDGRLSEHADPPVKEYLNLARRHGISAEQLALAFCLNRPFMGSVIIGATTLQQLELALSASEIHITSELENDILEVYRRYPAPI